MSLEKAKKYLEEKGYADHVIELEESSATVQLAAEALGVEQGMIAKTMSFLVDGEPILILTEGTAKVDNRKYKDQFHVKAKMIPFDEVEEYITQIAFSGATQFLEKYKDDANAIIGHFGLGFYSAFMVAKKVEIITKSHQEGAQAVKWTCDGSPEFTIENVEKESRGSDIILYIDDDCKEFLEETRISSLLTKYCRFLPIPIAFGKKKEWKDGKQVETNEDNVINETYPLWTRKPVELKDEDYKKFYQDLYPMSDEPLFWIHLNVDYPFHLTGILYFPLSLIHI